jgi:hypothetical protein
MVTGLSQSEQLRSIHAGADDTVNSNKGVSISTWAVYTVHCARSQLKGTWYNYRWVPEVLQLNARAMPQPQPLIEAAWPPELNTTVVEREPISPSACDVQIALPLTSPQPDD